MFRDLNRILSQNNRNGRSTTNIPGMNMQYANKHGNNTKNVVQNSFQSCNFTRKRKWQPEPDRLPLRMIVTPLVWRDNPEKENEIDQIPENSYGYDQRQMNGEKRRRTSGESFISHSQRILERIRGKQLQASLNKRNNLYAKESHTDAVSNTFSRTIDNSSELYSKNSPIHTSEVEHVLQTPMQNISLSSPSGQSPFNNTYRSSNNLSDSDESPSVPDKNTSFCENVLTDLKRRDNRPLSVESGGDCEGFCDHLVGNCGGQDSSLNSEEQFHWNPVVMNSPARDIDTQIDRELDYMLQDGANFIDKQIDQELDYRRQVAPDFENNHYRSNAECFNDFNESDESVLYNDSASSANSSHSSNNAVKNCFQQCEEYWSRGGQVCLKTTFEVSDVTKVSLKGVCEEDFYYFQDSD